MEATLKDRFVRQRRAEVLGNIIVMSSDSATARIQASAPLGSVGNSEEQFLLLSLDLVSFRRLTSTIGLAAATSFGLMKLLLAYFWGLQVQESREYREAFERVAEVMAESPTPYVRLTADDRFHDFSGSFLQLLGLGADEAKVLPDRTFGSFLADDKSREIYESVENLRREHKDVSPYHLTLRRVDGRTVTVRIVSAEVPDVEGGPLPKTFGILIRATDENVVPIDLVNASRLHVRSS